MARQLQQDLQLAVREADGLRVSLEEQQLSAGETEQQLRLWAQQLGAECQLLRHLVEPGGATQGSEPSPPRYSYYFFSTFFQFVEPWDRLHCLTLVKISLIDYQWNYDNNNNN